MKKALSLVLFILLLSVTPSLGEISKEKIEKVLPGSPRIDSLRFDQELRFYEVVSQGKVFYLSEDLRFLIVGNVIDLRNLHNLTADRIKDLRKVDFASLPKEDAIKISDGKRAIAVFTDTECPYCQKLHGELRKLKDTSIYVYLYPISDEGRRRSIQIWCSGEKVQALESAFNGESLKSASRRLDSPSCEDHPVDRNLSLGKRLLISGTPTIITERGEIINGYVDSERIQAVLEKGSSRKKID